MSYDVFVERVKRLAERSGLRVSFSHEEGRHIARCSDGVLITGNIFCTNVCVRWGDGHFAYATI